MTTTSMVTMAGKLWLRAMVTLPLREPPRPLRLPVVLPTGAPGLIFSLIKMLLPRALVAELEVPTTILQQAKNGPLELADGTTRVRGATEATQKKVASEVTPMRVPIVMVARQLTLTLTVIWLQPDSGTMDPALTPLLRADMAGALLRKLTLQLVQPLTEEDDTVLMALHGRMPAVMATLAPTLLDTALADGVQLLRVQLMLSLVRTVSRTVTSTVARPRMNTVMLTELRMPVPVATVATPLMAVVHVLPVTLPILAERVLPCVSELLVETDVHMLAAVAMAANTLALVAMQVKAMVPVASEVLALVVLAMLVMVQQAITETLQTLVLTAEEAMPRVDVAVPMAKLVAMALATVALVAMAVDPLAMAVVTVMAVLMASAAMAVITAMVVLVATELEEVATVVTEPAATVAMAIEIVKMVKRVISNDPFEVIKSTAKERFYPCYDKFV